MRKQRPRELSKKFGFQSLSTSELLALVLRVGSRSVSVYDLSREIASTFDSYLVSGYKTEDFLQQIENYVSQKSIKATVLGAVYELGRRNQRQLLPTIIARPDEIAKKFSTLMFKKQELVYGVYVDSRLRIIKEQLLAKGTTDAVYLEPRDALYYAIKHRTRRFMLVHNHPSGDPNPSIEDHELTKKLSEVANYFQVELLDHIIIAKQGYYSFREQSNML